MVFLIIFAFHYAHLQPGQKWFLYCLCDRIEAEAAGVPVPAVSQVQWALKGGKEPSSWPVQSLRAEFQ